MDISYLKQKSNASHYISLFETSVHFMVFLQTGPSNNFTTRFLGFSVYVSNTTDRLEGKLCFKDTIYNTSTIPSVFNTTCRVRGQYVIYYNERLTNVTYPEDYHEYAFNEICELEVYGKYLKIFMFCFCFIEKFNPEKNYVYLSLYEPQFHFELLKIYRYCTIFKRKLEDNVNRNVFL